MLFNSYIFVLFFLPIVILGYFLLNRLSFKRTAMIYLLGMSLWFYGFFNYSYLIIMISSIVINYFAYLGICKYSKKTFTKKIILIIALFMNIAALFYFKYYDFFIENINAIFKVDFALKHILLPLGISFFTFQQLSFVIDAYNGEVPEYSFVDYACFVTYFPQLVAGPIVTHDELVYQFSDDSKKNFNWDNFTKGLYGFVLGLSKKVLIADMLGNVVNYGYSNISEMRSVDAIIVILAYTIQIYFDFSGYSDMAIGMGKMMNIDLPINFNSPYKANTINEFWDRWHITLTRFFTKYVYIPLGGNRKGELRTYVNIMIVYLVSGIWHGANWTFIFWGLCHGAFCVITRAFKNFFEKIPKLINWLMTFVFVNIMWVFFRADTMNDAFALIKSIFIQSNGLSSSLIQPIISAEWKFIASQIGFLGVNTHLILLAYIIVPFIIMLCCKNVNQNLACLKPTFSTALMISILLTLCIISFA
ncbi:MAG: MBOAT family protein, partial [Clostridia bacterium]|nr:MBOAT family protein [Clostridia bacterium]